jgi:hypothetical protein
MNDDETESAAFNLSGEVNFLKWNPIVPNLFIAAFGNSVQFFKLENIIKI